MLKYGGNMETLNLLSQAKKVHSRTYLMRIFILVIILAIATYFYLPYMGALLNAPSHSDYNTLYQSSLESTKALYETPADFNNIFTFETVYLDENETITDYFAALINDEGNFVLAEIPVDLYIDEAITSYIGHFIDLEDDIYNSILEDLQGADFTYEQALEMMPSRLFVVEDNRGELWIFLAFILIGYTLLIYNIIKFLTVNNMRAYSKEASKFGDSDSILRELELKPINPAHVNFEITNNYVVLITKSKIKLLPANQVIWAYEKVVKRKLYFLITVNKIHSLIVATKDTRVEASLIKSHIQAALSTVEKSMPWVVSGYSDTLEKKYKKENDLFVSEVNLRRSEHVYEA